MRALARAAAVIAAAVGLVLLAVCSLPGPARPQLSRSELGLTYCSRLPGSDAELCRAYVGAAADAKFSAAIQWRHAGRQSCTLEQCASPCICLWIGQRGCMQQHAGTHPACVVLRRCDCVLHADDCAGIDVECLHGDLYATQARTSCRPLADGAACGAGGALQCWRGVCAGGCVRAVLPMLAVACMPWC